MSIKSVPTKQPQATTMRERVKAGQWDFEDIDVPGKPTAPELESADPDKLMPNLEGAKTETAEGESFPGGQPFPEDGIVPANLDNEEGVDEFLMLYFSFFEGSGEPHDKQIHALAGSLGIAPEELERHVYSMMTRAAENNVDEDGEVDTEELEPLSDEDFDTHGL